MFKCEICHKTSKSGEKQNKKVVEVRDKVYYYIDKSGKEKQSHGTEIVKEIKVCDKCYLKLIEEENNNEI